MIKRPSREAPNLGAVGQVAGSELGDALQPRLVGAMLPITRA